LAEAWLDLYAVGRIGYYDGVNYHSGRFEMTADSLSLFNMVETTVGYDGRDPHLLATIEALGQLSVASGRNGTPDRRDDPSAPNREEVSVGVSIANSLLELETVDCILMFRRAGTVYAQG
jgi:hypothetical protein